MSKRKLSESDASTVTATSASTDVAVATNHALVQNRSDMFVVLGDEETRPIVLGERRVCDYIFLRFFLLVFAISTRDARTHAQMLFTH